MQLETDVDDGVEYYQPQLYFQKAFAYFLLVRAFGAIPYFETDVDDGVEYYQPRMAIPEVYDKIIGLLTQASGMLYKNSDNSYDLMTH